MGGCLYLRIAPAGTKGWIFRFGLAGKMRDAGLGAFPTVSLGKARKQAEGYRQLVAAGVDPIETRKQEREAALLASAKAMTFEQCAKAFMASHDAGWKNDRHRGQWRATLATYCYPVLGGLPVQTVDTALVRKVLEPMWTQKPKQRLACGGASKRCLIGPRWVAIARARTRRDGAGISTIYFRPRARCAGSSTLRQCPIVRSAR